MSIIAERLRIARKKKGYKQTYVKDKTGINNKTLSGYENNVAEPDFKTLKTLAELYEVSVEWLIGNTDNPNVFTAEEQEAYTKIQNNVPLDKIAAEHEISFNGQVLNQAEKEQMLLFVETLLKMKKSAKKD